MSDERAVAALRRQEAMETERQPHVTLWEEIAELIDPRYVNTFRSYGFYNPTSVDKTQKQYDAAAPLALDKFGAAMDWMLTPRMQKWQRIRASDPSLNKSERVLRYFDEVRDILFKYRYAAKANFASQMFEHWIGLGSFGTAALFIDRLDGGGLRYKGIHLGEITFAENHQGIVDTAHRKFRMTARQAVQKFGDKNPEWVQKKAKDKPDEKVCFVHCVYPRSDRDPTRGDAKGMAYVSMYVEEQSKVIVQEGGYSTFPYAISRYVTAPGEIYGRSPAMKVLPNIRCLNEQKRTMLKMGQRAVDPVLLAHDDGVVGTIALKSGVVNYGAVTADGKKLVHALDTNSNLVAGKDMMDDERLTIKDAFLLTVWQILVETPEMTATEVLERVKEKGAMVAPMMGRQESECLGPMTERELDILARDGLLPEMPQELVEAGSEFRLVYDSPLSRAQRAEEASGFMRSLETAINLSTATGDPSALDWFDIDTAMPEIMDIQAVPAKWVSTMDLVQKKREGRQQAAAAQQLVDTAPAIASVLKTTGSGVAA